ncbi:hypothetical protein [Streptomyces sp. DH37]|nr:hypothetical protein [Streptomyces sp. DH37]MDG9703284.1 hypothetical protein [Streptomyces sp. DH37]
MTDADAVRGLDVLRAGIPIHTLTFAEDLSPSELLTRMVATA